MKAQKDTKTGKWLIQYRYRDWQGKNVKSTKRGFATKREAEEWLRVFLTTKQDDCTMNFEEFVQLYYKDMATRLREHTMANKKHLIELKILPYFGKKPLCDIKPVDIRQWQAELMKMDYSPTYLRSIHNQISAIFNYAVKYYDLKSNPAAKAGSMGKNKAEAMQFWTKQEFEEFSNCLMDKQKSYVIFMTLYWTGLRIGELLALTRGDVNLEKKTISVSKSYQRLNKTDVITDPKTPKSNRVVYIPDFLVTDLKEYFETLYKVKDNERIFPLSKSFVESEMSRGAKLAGLPKIRVHDIRHSHASLLVEMGFSPLEVAERLGHEKVETTLNTYSHLYPNKQEKLANRLEEIYMVEL
ncbi:MAG: site-specific integrase [Eubacteriales bacterium]